MALLAADIFLLSLLSTFWIYSLCPYLSETFDAHLQIHADVQTKEMHSQDGHEPSLYQCSKQFPENRRYSGEAKTLGQVCCSYCYIIT